MAIELLALPFALNDLKPYISAETLEYHYGKHHRAYVDKLNSLIAGTAMADKSLEEIIKTSAAGVLGNTSQGIFNNAAQVWNHSFYWNSLLPEGGGAPTGLIEVAIDRAFGSFDKFKESFSNSALTNFGSGWTWLVKSKKDGALTIMNTSNAGTPLTDPEVIPIFTVDVWEHAYYVDYRNARARYLEAFWKLINWEFAEQNYSK
jgi:Fe-Mn family superoxide dismutase